MSHLEIPPSHVPKSLPNYTFLNKEVVNLILQNIQDRRSLEAKYFLHLQVNGIFLFSFFYVGGGGYDLR